MLFLVISSMSATTAAFPSASDIHSSEKRTISQSLEQRCLPLPNGWRRQGCEFGLLATVNLLEIRQDRLVWNGRAISRRTLKSYLSQTHRLSPRPGIAIVIDDGSSKGTVAVVRRDIEARVGCDLDNVCVQYTASEWRRAQPPAGRNVL